MTDILFISPNEDDSILSESVGTLLLATILRNHGLQAKLIPFSRFGNIADFQFFLQTATNLICKEQPKIISFYTRCDNYHIVFKLAEQFKLHTNAYIVLGGPQADITAYETISSIPYVDFICCGEGETTVYPFFKSLLDNAPDLSVPGLVYRHNGLTAVNPRPAMLEDLDSLPDIDYTLYQSDKPIDLTEPFPIDVGRGCPFGCTYCSTKSFWGRKYRLKSPQRIVAEIQEMHDRFGATYFGFAHDMFTMNRKQVIQTCELLKQLDFPVTWRCSARIDCIDEELIDIMVDAGMVGIYIGIESGSQRIQQSINKKLKLETVPGILSYISSKKIAITTSFIFGFPQETEQDISDTIALIGKILQLRNIVLTVHLCTFLPGTELTNTYLQSLTPAETYSNITGTTALTECMDLINAHPALFPHFWEFKTELRSKLEFFEHFESAWDLLQPVYQYISEKYPEDQLINMYYDFVELNREILVQTKDHPWSEIKRRISLEDGFLEQLKDDPYIDIIRDIYRIRNFKYSKKLKPAGTITEIYCISPADVHKRTHLQDFTKKLTIVTYTKDSDGHVKMHIKGAR